MLGLLPSLFVGVLACLFASLICLLGCFLVGWCVGLLICYVVALMICRLAGLCLGLLFVSLVDLLSCILIGVLVCLFGLFVWLACWIACWLVWWSVRVGVLVCIGLFACVIFVWAVVACFVG